MRAGQFVGRVGGLAVALGIGVAVANSPGVAWADDTGSSSSDGATSSASSSDSGGTSESREASPRSRAADDSESDNSADDDDTSADDDEAAEEPAEDAESPASERRQRQSEPESSPTVSVDIAADVDPPDDPLTPVDSPLEMALLGLGTRPRSEERSAVEETTNLTADSTTMPAAMVNSAPTVPAQPVGIPNPYTGVVTGAVITDGPQGATLTYTVAVGPTKGAVDLNPQSGAYTYTPTQSARLAAGMTSSADTDAFTVAVSGGQQTTTATVAVYVSPTRLEGQAAISVGGNPSAVVVGADGRLYVANTGSGTVSVINTANNQRIDANSSIFSRDISVGYSPSALVLSADGKRLYVANTGSRTVSVIDTATYKRIDVNSSIFSRDISVGSSPSALALGGTRLYVANRGGNTVSVIDTTTNQVVDIAPNVSGKQSISVGTSPSALALGGTRLYVANRGSNTVSVIDTATMNVTATIAVGIQPSGMALGGGDRLYVVNTGGGTVSVINTVTNALVDTEPNAVGVNPISVGPSPTSVSFSPDGTFAYVANGNDTVSVIDTVTHTVVSTAAIDSDKTGGHAITVSANGTVYVTDATDRTVRVLAIARGNTAPVAGPVTVGIPDADTGVVDFTFTFSDADGDAVANGWSVPSTGSIGYSGGNTYTFTPTQAARDAAANGGPVSMTLTVTGEDNRGGSAAVSIAIPILPTVGPTRVTTLGTVTVPGSRWISPELVFSSDGTRALVMNRPDPLEPTGTTRVAVINTTTGKQTGSTLTLTGRPSSAPFSPLFSADGTRAFVATYTADAGGTTMRVVAINLATGTQAGTLTLIGASGLQLLSADGTRALVSTVVSDPTTGTGTRVSVINTLTGAQTGSALVLPGGQSGSPVLSADGSRAVITTSSPVWEASGTTRVAVLDTTTGIQIGTTVGLTGNASGPPVLTDGNRALITTIDGYGTTGSTTRVSAINLATGTQIGSTVTLPGDGSSYGHAIVSADGKRALMASRTYDSATETYSTLVAVINTATGAQVGATLSLNGDASAALSADSSRAVIIASASDPGTGTTTRVAVIDLATGAQSGFTLTGAWGNPLPGGDYRQQLLSADGSRVLLTRAVPDPNNMGKDTTLVAVINTITGAQTGATATLLGQEFGSKLVSLDGSRALTVTHVYDSRTSTNTARLTVIDTTTGAQIGTTTTLIGSLNGGVLFSADASRAVITTISSNFATTGIATTQVAVINTTTGTQAGTTLTLNPATGLTLLSADGTRALVNTGTQLAVLNTASGHQVGTTLAGGGAQLLSADGSRALIVTGVDPTKVTVLQIT